MTDTLTRISPSELPHTCPRCRVTAHWHRYHLIDDAPAAGCGACGAVFYLTKPLPGAVVSQGRVIA